MARPRTRRAAAESREKAEQAVEKAKAVEQIEVNADARKEDSVQPSKQAELTEQKSSGKRRRPSDLSPPAPTVDKRRKVKLDTVPGLQTSSQATFQSLNLFTYLLVSLRRSTAFSP